MLRWTATGELRLMPAGQGEVVGWEEMISRQPAVSSLAVAMENARATVSRRHLYDTCGDRAPLPLLLSSLAVRLPGLECLELVTSHAEFIGSECLGLLQGLHTLALRGRRPNDEFTRLTVTLPPSLRRLSLERVHVLMDADLFVEQCSEYCGRCTVLTAGC